ncbi:uncharacterized protein BX664DRAFT_324573 [Halteromyces radiatus]|uniref:uncharacterized protein n=1 Tax=Halteromyces radiatus TaxID=101107 RepID=UPI002220250C|nr:uncharacterized protein BX664DRAFT_324573 [Halteromyces radiatus]KAI8096668.1 hypothetical protein BX664DRAFT_324573 [Halteromyces radiatus]
MDYLVQASTTTWVLMTLAIYCGVVRYYRYNVLNEMKRKYPDPNTVLENRDVAYEIYSDVFRKEFPNVARTSLEFALFKTFVIPPISKLLCGTGEFEKRCTKRAEDTEVILSEMIDAYPRIQNHLMEGNTVSEKEIHQQFHRQTLATERLNEIHGKYPIRNGDYLYTISLFLSEPIRWINAFEWRELDIREINAIFRVWHDIGVDMKIQDMPSTKESLLKFKEDYEVKEIRYSPNNWKCAEPTIKHLLTRLPRMIWPIVYATVPCLLEKREIDGFGLRHPHWLMELVFHTVVRARALFIRYFCLPRSKYLLRTPFHANDQGRYVPHFFLYEPKVYPDGYCIHELGPEKMMPKSCPVLHHRRPVDTCTEKE